VKPPDLSTAVRAALAALAPAEHEDLRALHQAPRPLSRAGLAGIRAAALLAPDHPDGPLLRLARAWSLSEAEVAVAALLRDVELDVGVGRAVARLQAPLGGSRPTLALLVALVGPLADGEPLRALFNGPAAQHGLWSVLHPDAPLIERPLRMPEHLALALRGALAPPPGLRRARATRPQLPASLAAEAQRYARGLTPDSALIVRSVDPSAAEDLCVAVAAAAGRDAWWVDDVATPGLAAWLTLRDALPCFAITADPSAARLVAAPPGYDGAMAIATGPDGRVVVDGRSGWTWRVAVPPPAERRAMWRGHLPAHPDLADRLGDDLLLGPAAIDKLVARATREAIGDGASTPTPAHVQLAVRAAEGTPLDHLAVRVPLPADDTLVAPPTARADLEALRARCRGRDTLDIGLGPAAQLTGAPGVRALLHGPPGTGKTLAAGWLARQLGLPLFRVDLAGALSKYIGETEKNLAALLAAAEADEVVLLFDEADALFGKRTEVRSSNDRYANTQTNYLLQRLEAWSGIAILTTNHRAGLDDAFTRRLDAVIELPLPSPAERRALWEVHLGPQPGLSSADINRLAATLPVAGGHIRNAVLAGAVTARSQQRPLRMDDLIGGMEAELRKLGRQLPPGLRDR
jgi:hypothetical protein